MDYRTESPKILRDFLSYHETIKGIRTPPWMNTFWICACSFAF
jgi:hypothetical protein